MRADLFVLKRSAPPVKLKRMSARIPILNADDFPRTLADVLRDLGDVDAARIRWRPFPGTATVKDAVKIKNKEIGCSNSSMGFSWKRPLDFKNRFWRVF